MSKSRDGLTLKQLMAEVELHLPEGIRCQPYTASYLEKTHRLPLTYRASGKGDSHRYHPDCISILVNHILRQEKISCLEG